MLGNNGSGCGFEGIVPGQSHGLEMRNVVLSELIWGLAAHAETEFQAERVRGVWVVWQGEARRYRLIKLGPNLGFFRYNITTNSKGIVLL